MANYTNQGFNERGVAYADVSISFNGTNFDGITDFSLAVNTTKENNYGLGSRPVGRSADADVYEGSLTMTVETQRAIARAYSPDNLLVHVPAGVLQMSFYDVDKEQWLIKTYPALEFMNDIDAGSQGDLNITGQVGVIFSEPEIIEL